MTHKTPNPEVVGLEREILVPAGGTPFTWRTSGNKSLYLRKSEIEFNPKIIISGFLKNGGKKELINKEIINSPIPDSSYSGKSELFPTGAVYTYLFNGKKEYEAHLLTSTLEKVLPEYFGKGDFEGRDYGHFVLKENSLVELFVEYSPELYTSEKIQIRKEDSAFEKPNAEDFQKYENISISKIKLIGSINLEKGFKSLSRQKHFNSIFSILNNPEFCFNIKFENMLDPNLFELPIKEDTFYLHLPQDALIISNPTLDNMKYSLEYSKKVREFLEQNKAKISNLNSQMNLLIKHKESQIESRNYFERLIEANNLERIIEKNEKITLGINELKKGNILNSLKELKKISREYKQKEAEVKEKLCEFFVEDYLYFSKGLETLREDLLALSEKFPKLKLENKLEEEVK